ESGDGAVGADPLDAEVELAQDRLGDPDAAVGRGRDPSETGRTVEGTRFELEFGEGAGRRVDPPDLVNGGLFKPDVAVGSCGSGLAVMLPANAPGVGIAKSETVPFGVIRRTVLPRAVQRLPAAPTARSAPPGAKFRVIWPVGAIRPISPSLVVK